MKYPLLLTLSLAPLACAGTEPAAATPVAPPVVVDLTPPPVATVAAAPEAPKPEPVAAEKPADSAAPDQREGAELGMIGLLDARDPGARPLGALTTAKGNMWGADVDGGFGAGGLGLSGVGGGGGKGSGIGIGSLGSLGHGAPSRAQIRVGATTVNGRLPPEVIQRIVRQNFGRFRLCYELGLRGNDKLQGKVTIKLMIERDGSVSSVGTDAGGTAMPDKNVVACVLRGFGNLSFPQPEGGKVSVVYPLMFSPPDDAPAKPPPPAAAPSPKP